MREHERLARVQARLHLTLEHRGLHFVGKQQQNDGGAADGLVHRRDGESVAPGLIAVRVRAVADDDVDAAVAQRQRLRAALNAVSEHGNGFALERGGIGIAVVKDSARGGHALRSMMYAFVILGTLVVPACRMTNCSSRRRMSSTASTPSCP